MNIPAFRQSVEAATEPLLEAARQPFAFAESFDACDGEELQAVIADLAQLARLSVTLIELLGDRYRGDE